MQPASKLAEPPQLSAQAVDDILRQLPDGSGQAERLLVLCHLLLQVFPSSCTS